MKRIVFATIFFLGIAAGLFFSGIFMNISAERVFFKEIVSPFDFDKTVDVLTKRINAADGWNVTAVIDQQQTVLKNGGGDIGKLKIIQYCSGKYAHQMLKDDQRKKIAVMMPKSFAVYEKSDGRVYIALMNGAFMAKVLRGDAYGILENVSLEVEGMLSFIGFKYSLF